MHSKLAFIDKSLYFKQLFSFQLKSALSCCWAKSTLLKWLTTYPYYLLLQYLWLCSMDKFSKYIPAAAYGANLIAFAIFLDVIVIRRIQNIIATTPFQIAGRNSGWRTKFVRTGEDVDMQTGNFWLTALNTLYNMIAFNTDGTIHRSNYETYFRLCFIIFLDVTIR